MSLARLEIETGCKRGVSILRRWAPS